MAPLIPEDNTQEVNMTMEDRETFSLIGSDKVEGTNAYARRAKRWATSSAS